MIVQLGNAAPHEVLSRRDVKARGLKASDYEDFDEGRVIVPAEVEDAYTTFGPFAEESVNAALRDIVAMWPHMSGEAPSWVASDDEVLAAMVSREFGCSITDLREEEA